MRLTNFDYLHMENQALENSLSDLFLITSRAGISQYLRKLWYFTSIRRKHANPDFRAILLRGDQ